MSSPSASDAPSASALAYRNSSFYKVAASPYPEWSLSALCAVAAPLAKAGSGFPHFGVMMGFSAVWAGSGYMKYMKDADNGSGTTTAISGRKTIEAEFGI
ncbi:hypothetical protein BGZ99_006990 [Dissophora globulifera]|uniref:Uncharacterized protein n=1 Tax=Dissophora globulifera TaxID=979702 RepID=A0A9P6RUL5_9FUNG|nr:hypothetical protein BGZ99_006990 [Dissophora globulifera]